MNRLGLLLCLCLPACRDRGQDVPGGGWAGTPLEQRGRFQAERAAKAPKTDAAPPTAAPESQVPDAGAPTVEVDAPGIDAQAAIGLLGRLPPADATTESLLAEARRLAARDRLADALNEVGRAKVRDPEGAAVLLTEAWLLAKTGEHQAALRTYDLVLRQRPGEDEALYGKAIAHLTLGQKAEALATAQRLEAQRPNDPKIQRLVARLAPQRDQLAASAKAAATGDPAALREHADALLGAGRAAEAVDFYGLAAAQRGTDVDLHLRWGLALVALNRAAEAEAPLRRVTELAPERVAAWQGLADAREKRGDRAGAADAWQGLLDRTPGPAADPIRKQIARLRGLQAPSRKE